MEPKDLNIPSKTNIEYMIDWINKKLRVVNSSAINPANYNTDSYEELLDIYKMMKMRDRFSISEQEAIVTELGRLRKKE